MRTIFYSSASEGAKFKGNTKDRIKIPRAVYEAWCFLLNMVLSLADTGHLAEINS